jgi:hypothetical protein
MACSSLSTDNGPHSVMRCTNSSSISRNASSSTTNSVRHVIVEISRELTRPSSNKAATRGNRSPSATAMRISFDAAR